MFKKTNNIFATKRFVIFSFLFGCILSGNTIYYYIMHPSDKTIIWLFLISLLAVLNFGYQFSYFLCDKIIQKLDEYIDLLEKDREKNKSEIFKFIKSHRILVDIYDEMSKNNLSEKVKKENVFNIVKISQES